MSRLARQVVSAEGDGERGLPPLYVLHGFLGAGRNWSSFARRLVELRPDWRVVLVDLPLHGDSLDVAGPHTVAAAAREVVALPTDVETGASDSYAVLGHSFGGKIALAVTAMRQPAPVQSWIIDSTPAPGAVSGASERMLGRLEDSPAGFPGRDEAVAFIQEAGFDLPTARWMATNLERRGESWQWRLDPAGLRELLEDFAATDAWRTLEDPPAGADIHFVRAASGSLLTEEHTARIRELTARGEPVSLHELEGGHWLHVDNPEGLLELVAGRLPRLPVHPST